IVVSDKAKKTAIVEQTYTTFLKKYSRSLRNNSRIPAYNPECMHAKVGDRVVIGACRRLSRTKSFAIIDVLKRAES
ncbi:MAG: 30S ribosomal protein S17, partial [Candidatus Micrarchaeaceae archaeon]